MGRPKKTDGIPTKERILSRAIELFAVKGYEAVSVREITRGLALNEASLYNHYASKEELLMAIFRRFEELLTTLPPQEAEQLPPLPRTVDELIRYLQEGGHAFFARQGTETQLIWRILMMSQYSQSRARDQVKAAILDLPRQHFGGILAAMQAAGGLPADCDCKSATRIIAAIYIEYSLRAILDASWGTPDPHDLENLDRDLELAVRGIVGHAPPAALPKSQ
ncbi:MAG: TetR/AcrR family transcriptional regulator [Spirochaetes bacterium]|nr:TetR/AcrR family transcriptional regulator [Spirochaetota bacterium]MBU0956811.1 TetR/AcrR family transcriptional regulator [Spirochaetota bacterium]